MAADAIRRNDHHNALAGAVAGVGAAIAIGVMEWFLLELHYLLVIIPFATSTVLAGASLLTAAPYVWHRWIRRRPWPQRWL